MKQTFKNAFTSIFILLSFAMSAQETISGTITDENGVPLPGATIVVVETNDGTTTDFDGNYSINASEGQTILLSYVGYETLTLKVSDDSNFDISLKQSGALISSKFIAPNVGSKDATIFASFSGSFSLTSISKQSMFANCLKRTALPSITGLAARAPTSPRPNTADPLDTTATTFDLEVYKAASLGFLLIARLASATPGE